MTANYVFFYRIRSETYRNCNEWMCPVCGMERSLIWVEEGVLAIGQMILNKNDLLRLSQQGIKAVINLREQDYREWNIPGLSLYHIPIVDGSVPSREQVTEFLQIVNQHFMIDEPVYVHCTAGCGRTGTMVTLWLCSLKKWNDPREALQYLREIRPCVVENKMQEEFVFDLGQHLLS